MAEAEALDATAGADDESLSWLILRLPAAGAKAVVVEEAGAEGASKATVRVVARVGMWLAVEGG